MEPARTRGASGGGQRKQSPEKSPAGHRTLRRPKTLPNLISASKDPGTGVSQQEATKRVPSKVLLNVTVRGSLAALQVMASTEWMVGELIAALLQQYAKEGRRPRLPSSEPSDFGLHYSQFSLQGLDPGEKLIKLGSRNFFLCPKEATDKGMTSAPPEPVAEMMSALAGLRLVDFLL